MPVQDPFQKMLPVGSDVAAIECACASTDRMAVLDRIAKIPLHVQPLLALGDGPAAAQPAQPALQEAAAGAVPEASLPVSGAGGNPLMTYSNMQMAAYKVSVNDRKLTQDEIEQVRRRSKDEYARMSCEELEAFLKL
jgi:hypothetical protein